VNSERTELLLERSFPASTVTSAICWMLEHTDEYQQMRKLAWAKAHGLHSTQNFKERLLECVYDFFPGDRMPSR
jgi:hypothetical protein